MRRYPPKLPFYVLTAHPLWIMTVINLHIWWNSTIATLEYHSTPFCLSQRLWKVWIHMLTDKKIGDTYKWNCTNWLFAYLLLKVSCSSYNCHAVLLQVEQLHKIFKLCGSPPDDYWKRTKLPHATLFKPQQPYDSSLRETFKNLPKTTISLLETLLSVEPYKRGTAFSALASEVVTQCTVIILHIDVMVGKTV